MMTLDDNTGSSDAHNRQWGDIVPVPPRSGELAPKSCAGQNTSQVSTAGTRIGLATAGEIGPLEPPRLRGLEVYPDEVMAGYPEAPPPLREGTYLYLREMAAAGVVRDTVRLLPGEGEPNEDWTEEDRRIGRVRETYKFRGWLSGLRPGIKPFVLRGDAGGYFRRVTLEQLDREEWVRDWGPNGEYAAEAGLTPPPQRVDSGDEPEDVLSPLPSPKRGLRGGVGEDEDSDSGPAGPHRPGGPRIIGDQVLSGAERISIKRIVRATVEEGGMDVDVECVSVGSDCSPDSGTEAVEGRPGGGPSKPLKRARGRPRKDGSGPFKPPSPTNEELVDRAFEGDVPALNVVDIVPIVEKSAVRRAGGRLPERMKMPVCPDYGDSDEEETGLAGWRVQAMDTLKACDNKRAAVLALEALDRVDRARQKSKKGDVEHDLKVSSVIARNAILAVCQRSSRFGVDDAATEAINELRAECLQLQQKTADLRQELSKQDNSRRYLLAMGGSRDPTPAASPERPSGRGQKRSHRERRGVPDPEPEVPAGSGPPADPVSGEVEPWDPLIPEVVMGSPAREEVVEPMRGRSLSPMARFAAADPQIMGVLQDIVGSLRGLERHMAALEERPRPPRPPTRGAER